VGGCEVPGSLSSRRERLRESPGSCPLRKRDQLSTGHGRLSGRGVFRRSRDCNPQPPADSQRVPRNIQTGTYPNTARTAGTQRNLLTGEGVGLDLNMEISKGVGGICCDGYPICNGVARCFCRRIDSISYADDLWKSRRRGYASERKDCATGVCSDMSLPELQHQAGSGFPREISPSQQVRSGSGKSF